MTALPRVLLLLSLCAPALACKSEPTQPLDRYEVRAEVKEAGGEGADARATLSHEAIPTFKDRKGKQVGMQPMTMAFGLDPRVDSKLFQPGAKVDLTVEVDWDREPALLIIRASALPADTVLSL